jgi:hypothetical protein
MKKKPQRVPDFSTAKRPLKGTKVEVPLKQPAPPAPHVVIKPQATSSKSGQRGT